MLVAGGVRVPIRDDFPKGIIYDILNTKALEIAELKRKEAFARNAKASDDTGKQTSRNRRRSRK